MLNDFNPFQVNNPYTERKYRPPCRRSTLKGGGGAPASLRDYVMAATTDICTSSGVPLVEDKSTSFPCPECGESIGRSERCRVQAVAYVCPHCGFVGP